MNRHAANPAHYLIGEFRFYPAQRRLCGRGREYLLALPVSRVLALLSKHAGRPLEREWLLEQAWNGVDVSDESLSKAVSKLRACLDDPSHQFIETLHGVGYVISPDYVKSVPGLPTPAASRPSAPRRHHAGVAVGACLGLMALIVSISTLSRSAGDSPPAEEFRTAASEGLNPTNLTYHPGLEFGSQLSPDGRHLAYIRQADGQALMTQAVGAHAEPVELVPNALLLRWCPEGDHLAYLTANADGRYDIGTIRVDGSEPVHVASTRVVSNIDWTPDHSALLFSDFRQGGSITLFSQALDASEPRQPVLPGNSPGFHLDPRVSPDGRLLAYRDGAFPDSQLVVVKRQGHGQEIYRGPPSQSVRTTDWLTAGNALAISMRHDGRPGIWKLNVDQPQPVPQLLLETPQLPSLSTARNTGALTFSYPQVAADVVLLEQSDSGFRADRRLGSTEIDWLSTVSPSGEQIAFLSDRAGTMQVWLNTGGDGMASPLDVPGTPTLVAPAWATNNHHLVLVVEQGKQQALAVVNVATGTSLLLDLPGGFKARAVSFAGPRQIPVAAGRDAGKQPVVLARRGDHWIEIAAIDVVKLEGDPSAEFAYAATASGYGLWQIRLDGRQQQHLNVPINPLTLHRWDVIDGGLVISRSADAGEQIEFWSWTGQSLELEKLFKLPPDLPHARVSADRLGRVLALDRRQRLGENIQLLPIPGDSYLARK